MWKRNTSIIVPQSTNNEQRNRFQNVWLDQTRTFDGLCAAESSQNGQRCVRYPSGIPLRDSTEFIYYISLGVWLIAVATYCIISTKCSGDGWCGPLNWTLGVLVTVTLEGWTPNNLKPQICWKNNSKTCKFSQTKPQNLVLLPEHPLVAHSPNFFCVGHAQEFRGLHTEFLYFRDRKH